MLQFGQFWLYTKINVKQKLINLYIFNFIGKGEAFHGLLFSYIFSILLYFICWKCLTEIRHNSPWSWWIRIFSEWDSWYLPSQQLFNSVSTRKYFIGDLSGLSDSYWLSIFTPSFCLMVAAELTLFIDEAHFKPAITVSLTTNLVMYTLNRRVQEKLPDDSSLKLIEIWLLHNLDHK